MFTYKKILNPDNSVSDKKVLRSDNACIPFDEANTDYQAFLLWKSEGNQPTPADEVTK